MESVQACYSVFRVFGISLILADFGFQPCKLFFNGNVFLGGSVYIVWCEYGLELLLFSLRWFS